MKILNSIYDFCNYGSVVYRSPKSGNVIRRKTFVSSGLFLDGICRVDSTRTVLDKDGNVIRTFVRKAKYETNKLTSEFTDIVHKPSKKIKKRNTYIIDDDSKQIITYPKSSYLDNFSEDQNQVLFPDITTISKDGIKKIAKIIKC